jgi:non-specific serine/threonine protein kinase
MASVLWRSQIARGKLQHVQRRAQAAQEQYDAARMLIERVAGTLDGRDAQQFSARALALVPRVPQPTANQRAKAAHGGLTTREREVAALVAHGKTNREIAHELVLSERTVEKHVENVKHKLGFETRAQVAVWAASQNLRG